MRSSRSSKLISFALSVAIATLGLCGCGSDVAKRDTKKPATNEQVTDSQAASSSDETLREILGSLLESQGSEEEQKSQDERFAALSPIEQQRILSTAKILRAAKAQFPYPGEFKLVEGDNGEELWQARGDTGSFGGTLRVSTFGSGPKTFNVWAANEVTSHGIGYLMYDPLVDVDAWTGEFKPKLAREFSISDDHKKYVFKLRKGLKWSDGHPLTAEDVLYTFNVLVKKGYGSSSVRDTLMVKGKFPTVKKVDDLTITVETDEPFAPLLSGIRNVSIGPKHVLEKITAKPMDEFHNFWDINCDPDTMVVSGPFKLKRYVAGQRVEMVRNENYSMVDREGKRLPYLDRLVLIVVPDQNTQILKFYGHELDFLDIRSVRGFDAALMKQKEGREDFSMYNLGPDDGTTFIMLNMCKRKDPKSGEYYVDPVKQKWFNSTKFRQAISHAINRRRLVDNILKGVGLPIYSDQSAASLWFNANLKAYDQDLELSRKLLAEGGFDLKNGELYDSEGHRVEFVLQTNAGNTARDGTCIMIVNDLAQLGIKVNYQPIAWNILIDKTSTSLKWEAVVMGLTGNKIEPYDGANVWKADGRLHMFDQRLPDKDGNVPVTDARDWELEINKCFDLGATTFDSKKRHDFFNRYQEITYEEVPYIYLYAMLDITAMSDSVGNYRPTPLGIYYTPKGTLHNIEEIYFKGEGK